MLISEIELSKRHIKLLKRIAKSKSGIDIRVVDYDTAVDLEVKGLIHHEQIKVGNIWYKGKGLLTINQYGIDWLDSYKDTNLKLWVPITISAVALLKSFLPELISGMKLIAQLWK